MFQAMIDAGWIITGSWAIDTEMGTRMNAMGTAALASSVHIVCRPRTPHSAPPHLTLRWRLARCPARTPPTHPRMDASARRNGVPL
jgi:adenine-specific DNA methylase